MYRDYQARILAKQDKIKQILADNLIELAGAPTDCVRIRAQKNDEGDLITRVVTKADLVSIVFPPLKDIPYRTLDNIDGAWRITSLVNSQADSEVKNYIIHAPHNKDLRIDDLIFRVFVDPEVTKPIVLGLQVTEQLADIGQNSLVLHKYNTVIYTEELPEEMVRIVSNFALRRLKVGF